LWTFGASERSKGSETAQMERDPLVIKHFSLAG
jgi:hypothetical protein